MAKRHRMHITGAPGNWKRQIEGNERASFRAKTKEDAIQKDRKQMGKAERQLFIHKTDCSFQEERTYSNDPYLPKG